MIGRIRTAGSWVVINVLPLVLSALATYGLYAIIRHVDLPAHGVQGERQVENVERLTRLETRLEALEQGKRGHRWKSTDMGEWCSRLGEANEGLVVPDPGDVLTRE